MKHVILYYFFILYLFNVQKCASVKRHRIRNGHYDINTFISQLLTSSKFDELAEKIADKAANRIMYLKKGQFPVDRANEDSEVQNNTEPTTENTQTQSEEKREKVYLRKGFTGKINPNAVMNESTSRLENLMLKYKLLKKALETKIQKERDMISKNVTNDESKVNKTIGPAVDEKKDKEGETTNANITQRSEDDVKKELSVEKNSLRDGTKDDHQKVEPERNNEPKFEKERTNESSKNNFHQPEEPNPILDEGEHIFRVKHNSAEQEAVKVDKEMKEEIPTSLDEQNRNYSPSEENTNVEADVGITQDRPRLRAHEEIIEVGNGAYFRGRKDSIEENVVPRYETPNPSRSVRPNDSGANGGSGSHERFPEDQSSNEKENVEPAKPVHRTEGDKVYTYNQNSEYQDYHEKMAKWRKKHPENPAEFL